MHRLTTRFRRASRWLTRSLVCLALLTAMPAIGLAQSAAPAPWYERIQFGGDFRSRYEGFYQDGRTSRHRGRLRLRLRIDSDINDDTHLQIQIASGDAGTPVSTNQTFTRFFRPKPFNLDRANIAYIPQWRVRAHTGCGQVRVSADAHADDLGRRPQLGGHLGAGGVERPATAST